MSHIPAKKSLGQNFLKSKKAIFQMITAADTQPEDLIIEIGPGKGALTRPILETGAHVIAFELDTRMIKFLEVEFAHYIQSGKLHIIHMDVLEINMKEFFCMKMPYKVIANIPYYITNAIIRKFLETEYQPTDMSLLMQKEVAERIVVRNGKQSILALSVSVFATPKYISKVQKKYFSPMPKVDSAIVHIGKISRKILPTQNHINKFFTLIKTGFGQKRKQVINNLEALQPKSFWKKVFVELNIPEKSRAEDIDLKQWLAILQKNSSE
jgi:16S rRNA (adenine1518-N6/adenine1519-N6)-dimethyltransferase